MNDLHHPCERWAERISLAAAGCLLPDEEQEVRRHIETCSDCRQRSRELVDLCDALAQGRSPAEGPKAAIVERVMSAIAPGESTLPQVRSRAKGDHSARLSQPLNTWRWIMRSRASRVSATVVLALAVTGVAFWFHGGGATFAFADFVAPILEAKTARFKVATVMKGPPAATMTGEVMVLDAARSRQEMVMPHNSTNGESSESKMVMIFDWGQGKSLTLDPATKQATVVSLDNLTEEQAARQDTFGWFRSILLEVQDKPDVKREPLGTKDLDGRRVIGFRVTAKGMVMSLWGDPKTGLPVQAEMAMAMFPGAKTTLSDFEFDVDMDESLFRVEPPPGYTVRNMVVDASAPEETDLITALRTYGELGGGTFPDSLDMQTILLAVGKMIGKKNALEMLREQFAAGNQELTEEQIREFTELTDKMVDLQLAAAAGIPNEEELKKVEERLREIKGLATVATQMKPPSPEEVRKRAEAHTQEFLRVQMLLQRGVMFASTLPPEAEARYAGKGVSTNEAGKPIFWYRPKEAAQYRVIYADFSVRVADTPPNASTAQPVPAVR